MMAETVSGFVHSAQQVPQPVHQTAVSAAAETMATLSWSTAASNVVVEPLKIFEFPAT
jgi:hypothetical protein